MMHGTRCAWPRVARMISPGVTAQSHTARSAYVEDVDTALSMEVIAKYSKAREGELKVRGGGDTASQPHVAVAYS